MKTDGENRQQGGQVLVSVVIGSYNRYRFLKMAIQSIRTELEHASLVSEIIVVDGGSTDGSLAWLLKQKDILTIIQHNRGEWRGRQIECRSWGYFMNLGFLCAQGKYVCMLSDDCLVVPGAIKNGIDLFDKRLASCEKIGAMAFYWRNWPEQKKYWIGLTFGGKIFVNHGIYLKQALNDVGYVDEESYSFYHADGDLCLKMWQQGYECIAAPDSYIEHYSHSCMRNLNMQRQKKDWENYRQKWEPLYPAPETDWLEKFYVDEKRTAEQFKKRWLLL